MNLFEKIDNIFRSLYSILNSLEGGSSLYNFFVAIAIIIAAIFMLKFMPFLFYLFSILSNFLYKKNKENALKVQSSISRKKAKKYLTIDKKTKCLTLKNGKISLEYNEDLQIYKLNDLETGSRYCKAEGFFTHNADKVFNAICVIFNENTDWNEVFEILEQTAKFVTKSKNNLKKINLNSCTINEMTKLPGINIALAKKIIEARSKKNGFSSMNEFLEEFKIKDNFARQIKEMAEVQAENLLNSFFNSSVAKPAAPQPNDEERRVDF